jgi:Spy/CpxP family protein refolding chaperone
VGLVFVCGGVLGFFANRLYTATTVNANAKNGKNPPTPEEFRKWLIGQYQTRLKLTDDQVQKVNLILDESQAQVNAIHGQMDPQLDAVRQNQITRMKLMLSPEQQTKYDQWREERQRERQKQDQQRRGGRANGGPGF